MTGGESSEETRLAVPPHPGAFVANDLDGLPPAARRLLAAAIETGTPLAAAARIRMRGSIKLNRWLPFRARQIIAPGVGFEWRARVAGVVAGFDRCLDGHGEMRWKLARLITVASGVGPDVSRSAAGREAGEAFWLPMSLLPRFGVDWREDDTNRATARVRTSFGPIDVAYTINAAGNVTSLTFPRWGDPEQTGTFGLHTFGGTITEHQTFEGVTIPTKGSVGWHFGKKEWSSGEFFRFEITDYELVEGQATT